MLIIMKIAYFLSGLNKEQKKPHWGFCNAKLPRIKEVMT